MKLLNFLYPAFVKSQQDAEQANAKVTEAAKAFTDGVTRASAKIELLRADPEKKHSILFVFGEPLAKLQRDMSKILDVPIQYSASPEEGLLKFELDSTIKLVVLDAAISTQVSLGRVLKEFRSNVTRRDLATLVVLTGPTSSEVLARLDGNDSAVKHPLTMPDLVALLLRMYSKKNTGEHKIITAEILR